MPGIAVRAEQMPRSTRSWVPPPRCGDATRLTLRLVVNSFVPYAEPRRALFASLHRSGFGARFADMIVVLGGSGADSVSREPLAEDSSPAPPEVTVIRTTLNSFDLHGLAMLYRYLRHPHVQADTYFYVQDTTTVDEVRFIHHFEAFRMRTRQLIFTAWPLPSSNLAVFDRSVVLSYKDNFDVNVSKSDGLIVEAGRKVKMPPPSRRVVLPLASFGGLVRLAPRRANGSFDVYGSGKPRHCYYYPAFALYKFWSPGWGDLRQWKGSGRGKQEVFDKRAMSSTYHRSSLVEWRFAGFPDCWFLDCPVGGAGSRMRRRFPLFPDAIGGTADRPTPPRDADGRAYCERGLLKPAQGEIRAVRADRVGAVSSGLAQTDSAASSPEDGSQIFRADRPRWVPPPRCGDATRLTLRLVVNSFVPYAEPRRALFASLHRSGFGARFADMIVVLGGSGADSVSREPLAEDSSPAPPEVTVIRTTLNSFDLHGLAMLYRYLRHPHVQADTYFYVQDTTTVDEVRFIHHFEAFRMRTRQLIFTAWPLPSSNLAVFDRSVVLSYKDNFDVNVSKSEALVLEAGRSYTMQLPSRRVVRPLASFGGLVRLASRRANGSFDVYGSGTPRHCFYYPAFALYKFWSPAWGDLRAWKGARLRTRAQVVFDKRTKVTADYLPRSHLEAYHRAGHAEWRFAALPDCWYLDCPVGGADSRMRRRFPLFPEAVFGNNANSPTPPRDADGRAYCERRVAK